MGNRGNAIARADSLRMDLGVDVDFVTADATASMETSAQYLGAFMMRLQSAGPFCRLEARCRAI